MYVKLFSSMFDGSLGGKRDELLVFLFMLAKADADGVVDIHPKHFVTPLGMSYNEVCNALVNLESPDPDSRTPDEEGRRIIRIDDHRNWGWTIVNYEKYKQIRNAEDRREANRLAAKEYRKNVKDRHHPSSPVITRHQKSSTSAHTDTDTDTESTSLRELRSPVEDLSLKNKFPVDLEESFKGLPPELNSIDFKTVWHQWEQYLKVKHDRVMGLMQRSPAWLEIVQRSPPGDTLKFGLSTVRQAIANGWKGLYPKEERSNARKPVSSTPGHYTGLQAPSD